MMRGGDRTLAGVVLTVAVLLSAAFVVQGAPDSSAAPARYRTRALLSGVGAGRTRTGHLALLFGRVRSRYRPCESRRIVRFYHRVGARDLYLGRGLKGPAKLHRTSRTGSVLAVARVGNPRKGAYLMKVRQKKLPSGALCLPAKSNLRRPR